MDSNSSEESSSDYSTTSSEDDGMETAQINGSKLQLPQSLCERQDVFRELFSVELWNSLSEGNKQHLQTFLPNFPENDDLEKSKTLQRLFDCKTFRFSSPLVKFHDDLRAGYFRPEIARMRRVILKAERKEAKYRYKTFREKLKYEVIESQRKLLNQIKNLPPGVEPKQEKRKLQVDYISHRTKKRYFNILSNIRSKVDDNGVSSDENYPEGPTASLSRKQKRHLNSVKNSISKERFFTSTMTTKPGVFDLEKYVTPTHNPFYINDEAYRNLIYDHKKRKLDNTYDLEMNTKGITLSDIVHRTQLSYVKNTSPPRIPASKHHDKHSTHRKKIKKEPAPSPEPYLPKCPPFFYHHNHLQPLQIPPPTSNSESDSDSPPELHIPPAGARQQKLAVLPSKPPPLQNPLPPPKVKVEVVEVVEPLPPPLPPTPPPLPQPTTPIKTSPFSQYGKITPVKVEDLEGIDMMNIPIDLDADIDILELNTKPELMQETHSNFFSLIRDVICSTNEHRMNMYALQERLKTWQDNPISPLNDWYSLTDNWIGLLPSAITFLCGNSSEQPDDFVPYMEYKMPVDMYQWIGAGRDTDGLLSTLCSFWLDHRTEATKTVPSPVKEKEETDVDVTDRAQTPPPPRFPTNWTVRKATPEEIKQFRDQERKRYDNPHKAFTYRCNGYESVVGPLKGIYNPAVGNTKARGHTMLNADRPNFVTILSLVRDATARLPNGEGTRAEICELLKSSQYISSTAPDNILQSVVSGALDRMHTQFDPCVKYDPKRKIWIYLHRNRTEEDFERIHQQYQGMNKTKKTSTKKSPGKSKPKIEKAPKPPKVEAVPVADPPVAVEVTKTPQRTVPKPAPTLPSPTLVPVQQKPAVSSLLLSNNVPKPELTLASTPVTQTFIPAPPLTSAVETPPPQLIPSKLIKTEESEINQALQAIVQTRVASPTIKSGKSLVKILPPAPGKSLIIPTTNSQFIRQIQEQKNSPKQMNVVAQQFLQTLNKQLIVQKHDGQTEPRTVEQKIKVPVSIQQQIIQSITSQQLHNIKNVTLLRPQNQNVSLTHLASGSQTSAAEQQNNIVTVAVSKQAGGDQLVPPNVQIKTHGNLTPAQQQQILQTIKQKILPQGNVLQPQQQIILKPKVPQVQKVQSGASILSQTKTSTESPSKAPACQGPVVAKVLTNAAGQVISVESLLAHQKQHGSLPQGTTLRVSGTKGGPQNIIHLTGSSKSNAIAQFTLNTSQNNIIALTTQPKLVVASPTTVTTTVASPKPIARTVTKAPTVTKFPPKIAQQLINAKIITQNIDGQKIVQPKLVMSQPNHTKVAGQGKSIPLGSKPVTLSVAGNAGNTIRMVNAANLNLTHIGGKPVLLASKGGTIQNIQGQNVILQTQSNASGTSLVLQQNNIKNSTGLQTSSNNLMLNQQNIVFAPHMKVNQPQVVFSTTGMKNAVSANQANISQSHLVLSGHPVRLQTSNASNTQRVVLASQGQGGQIVAQQILLPAGFQGTAINIKALQGVKVIPIAQATGQGKGVQGRQVFARVMSPGIVKTTQPSTPVIDKPSTDSIPSSD